MKLTLNSPITDEQFDAIMDVDFEKTDSIWFNTKNGKQVEFVKRSKGRWIRDFDGNEFHTYCSNCNEEFYEEDLVTVGDERLPNYCPLCGADMRGNGE